MALFFGWGREYSKNYDSIFGVDRPKTVSERTGKARKDKQTFWDGERAKDILKIGKEIVKYKTLDKANNKMIDAQFLRDANKFVTPPENKELIRNITETVVRGLRNPKSIGVNV